MFIVKRKTKSSLPVQPERDILFFQEETESESEGRQSSCSQVHEQAFTPQSDDELFGRQRKLQPKTDVDSSEDINNLPGSELRAPVEILETHDTNENSNSEIDPDEVVPISVLCGKAKICKWLDAIDRQDLKEKFLEKSINIKNYRVCSAHFCREDYNPNSPRLLYKAVPCQSESNKQQETESSLDIVIPPEEEDFQEPLKSPVAATQTPLFLTSNSPRKLKLNKKVVELERQLKELSRELERKDKCVSKHSCGVCHNFSKQNEELDNSNLFIHFAAYNTRYNDFGSLKTSLNYQNHYNVCYKRQSE
ncbi:unnamed protein product [Brassicogethes aeneus]|uniref:THAP-type domain-containing protein n=1 Tax=Brassicogethes aeneus TaxID=1431903 RepID=A0A9P0FB26_BRAAE|nr:unnamed protein product [Brassicogethes aeneus]